MSVTSATSLAVSSAFATCAVSSSGTTSCWGYNQNGELGNGTTTPSDVPIGVLGVTTATTVVGGGAAFCALEASGGVYWWGEDDL